MSLLWVKPANEDLE